MEAPDVLDRAGATIVVETSAAERYEKRNILDEGFRRKPHAALQTLAPAVYRENNCLLGTEPASFVSTGHSVLAYPDHVIT